MSKYKLTEPEAREIAAKLANRNVIYPDGTFGNWFSKYMDEYSQILDEIKKYNQTAEDWTL